jgi:short-subunit dehydrogenase
MKRSLLIAGGTDGIGYAFLTLECERRKYDVIYVLGRNFQRIDTELMPLHKGRIVTLACDITNGSALRCVLDGQIDDDGLDTFVNTIGTYIRGTIAQMGDDDVVAQHFQLNCIANINLIRAVLPKLKKKRRDNHSNEMKMGPQILVCGASLAIQARSPYALQSATKAGLKFFVDALRIELKGQVRVMSILPPSVDTNIFKKAGDMRDTTQYPPAERVADAMRYMLDCPQDMCIPELILEQHEFELNDTDSGNSKEEKLPRYRDHGGYLVAWGFPVEGFNSALQYEAQDNDLFIVTYPKVS